MKLKLTVSLYCILNMYLMGQNKQVIQEEIAFENPRLLIGVSLSLKDNVREDCKSFYIKIDKNRVLSKNIKISKIKDFKFVLEEIISDSNYESKNITLKLTNPEIGVIYYSYYPKGYGLHLRTTDKFSLPEDYFSRRLSTKKDKFSTDVSIMTPVYKNFTLHKEIKNNESTIYLRLKTYGTTLTAKVKGVTILLKNGTILNFENIGIDVEVPKKGDFDDELTKYFKGGGDSEGWYYIAFIPLTENDINNLLSSYISDYKLYIHEDRLNKRDAFELQECLKCLTN